MLSGYEGWLIEFLITVSYYNGWRRLWSVWFSYSFTHLPCIKIFLLLELNKLEWSKVLYGWQLSILSDSPLWTDRIHLSRLMTKPTKWLCAQWRLGSAWSSVQSDRSLHCAKDPSFLHANSEDSDQTGRMPRLIWVFAGCTLILLVLSCHGSLSFSRSCDILIA